MGYKEVTLLKKLNFFILKMRKVGFRVTTWILPESVASENSPPKCFYPYVITQGQVEKTITGVCVCEREKD